MLKPSKPATALIHCVALLCLLLGSPALAQSNESPNQESAPAQIWDYSEQLSFSDEQIVAMEKLRQEYEAARTGLRQVNTSELPPDQKQVQRIALAEKIRDINRQISDLLTDEQKTKFTDLRTSRRVVRPSTTARSSEETDVAQTELEETSHFTRVPPRPQMTDEEYRQLSVTLRALYAKPSNEWPEPNLDDPVPSYFVELGLLPPIKYPTNNPYSDAKAELGKKLFFDPRLSGSGQIACASCHDAELGWSDGKTVSFGHNRKALKRNSQTLLNVGHNDSFFWDGRAGTLEDQVIQVIHNEDEMHSSAEVVRERLEQIPGYTNEFAAIFGTPEITLPRVAQAIATFERTITSRSNPFDSFLRGNTNSLSDSAIRGLHLFRTEARCIHCHHGPNFTDNRFHDEGLSYFGRKLQDLGRYEVTKEPADVGGFRTPTLRNISRTAPYMHNGLFDLDGVLNLYNAGMPNLRPRAEQKDDPLFPKKSALLKPLALNKQDLQDLKAFLESLTEARHRVPPPILP